MAFTRNGISLNQTFMFGAAALTGAVFCFNLPDTAMMDGLVTVLVCTLMLAIRSHFASELKEQPDKLFQAAAAKEAPAVPDDAVSDLAQKTLDAARNDDWDIVEVALKEGDLNAAEKLMEGILALCDEPASVSFNTIINRCSSEGDADRAAHWLEEMLVRGVEPNAATFNPVISMLARRGDVDEAFRWQGLMRLSHVKPDVQCYKTLLCACSAIDDTSRAQQLFDEMHDEEHSASKTEADSKLQRGADSYQKLPAVCYNAAVQAWAEAGYPRRAEYWLRQAIGAGCQISNSSYSSIVAAFKLAGLDAEGDRWCKLSDIAARAASSRTASLMMQCQ